MPRARFIGGPLRRLVLDIEEGGPALRVPALRKGDQGMEPWIAIYVRATAPPPGEPWAYMYWGPEKEGNQILGAVTIKPSAMKQETPKRFVNLGDGT